MYRTLALALAFASLAPTAHAQSSDAAAFTEAMHAGETELEAHHYPEARALFLRALAISPDSRPLVRLGQTEFEMREYVACVQHLRAALADTAHPVHSARDRVTDLLTRARVFVGEYRLTLDPPDASVTVDDAPLASTTEPLLLAIGDHTIVVRASGRPDLHRAVHTAGGEDQPLALAMDPATSAPVVTTATTTTDPTRSANTPPPPAGPRVHVRIEASRPGLALHRAPASAPYGHALVCVAPCEADVEAGNASLAIADGNGTPTLAEPELITLDADTTLALDYDNRGDLRTAGVALLFGGILASLIPVIAGLVTAPSLREIPDGSAAAIVTGVGIFGVSIILGPALAFLQDHAEVHRR